MEAGAQVQLPLRKKLGLWLHLAMCRSCGKYREQLRILKAAARGYFSAQPSLSGEERRRLEDGIIARLFGKKH